MILGHEACGYVEEIGDEVTSLSVGDFVALEPGIPCHNCKECLTGKYNLCKDVKFWATPPINGALVEYVLHPESFTYKLPKLVPSPNNPNSIRNFPKFLLSFNAVPISLGAMLSIVSHH